MPEPDPTPTPDPTPDPTPTPTPTPPASRSLEDLLSALPEADRAIALGEVSKARSEAKGLRDRLKPLESKAGEYDKLVEASKTETERALEAARLAEGKAQAATERIAAAEIKAALAGVVPDPAAVVGDLNVSKFLTESGDVDTEAVSALRDRYAALVPAEGAARTPKPNPAQSGNAKTPPAGQLDSEALKTMSPEAIVDAREKGLFNDLLGVKQ